MMEQRTGVTIDGTDYEWWVSRQPQWCHEDGWQGIQVTVEPKTNPNRLLLIQFPFSIGSRRSTPHKQRPKVSPEEVVKNIELAIVAGWTPQSKGKAFRYEATANT